MQQIEIADLPQRIDSLRAAIANGEEIILTQASQPIAKLVQVTPRQRRRKVGSAKGQIKMSADFNEPLDDFADYIP